MSSHWLNSLLRHVNCSTQYQVELLPVLNKFYASDPIMYASEQILVTLLSNLNVNMSNMQRTVYLWREYLSEFQMNAPHTCCEVQRVIFDISQHPCHAPVHYWCYNLFYVELMFSHTFRLASELGQAPVVHRADSGSWEGIVQSSEDEARHAQIWTYIPRLNGGTDKPKEQGKGMMSL